MSATLPTRPRLVHALDLYTVTWTLAHPALPTAYAWGALIRAAGTPLQRVQVYQLLLTRDACVCEMPWETRLAWVLSIINRHTPTVPARQAWREALTAYAGWRPGDDFAYVRTDWWPDATAPWGDAAPPPRPALSRVYPGSWTELLTPAPALPEILPGATPGAWSELLRD